MRQLSEMELDGNPRSSRVRLNVRLLLVSFILLGAPITIIVVVWYQNSLQSAQTQYRGTVQYSTVQYSTGVQYSTLQYSTEVQYSTVQGYSTVQYRGTV